MTPKHVPTSRHVNQLGPRLITWRSFALPYPFLLCNAHLIFFGRGHVPIEAPVSFPSPPFHMSMAHILAFRTSSCALLTPTVCPNPSYASATAHQFCFCILCSVFSYLLTLLRHSKELLFKFFFQA